MTAATSDDVRALAAPLRKAHLDTLANRSHDQIVESLSELARRWRLAESTAGQRARALTGLFGYDGVELTLTALLDSLTPNALNDLIDSEGVRGRPGFPVIGHVLAGNTPLLGWTSMIRALLGRSASFVKLPTEEADLGAMCPTALTAALGGHVLPEIGSVTAWSQLFVDALVEVDAPLASTIALASWPGEDDDRTGTLCTLADLVVAYGSDDTIASLAKMRGGLPFVGYGHRVSFGVVMPDANLKDAADGFALDTLLFDQGGCLSPQSIFVIGDSGRAADFAQVLAKSLRARQSTLPPPPRDEGIAVAIRRARALARMDGCRLWEDEATTWTVVLRRTPEFAPSPTHGVISVQPLSTWERLTVALAPVEGALQGCGLTPGPVPAGLGAFLSGAGVSYVCVPGKMQAPPLSWREDGVTVLSSLLP